MKRSGVLTVGRIFITSPQGGGVPVHDELIISLANMSEVRSFDPVAGLYLLFAVLELDLNLDMFLNVRHLGVLVADAGCILENLITYLAPHKHIMPLDLGAKGRLVLQPSVA